METPVAVMHNLEKIHQLALDNRIAFVSYGLPGQREITTLVQWKDEPAVVPRLEALEDLSGFVFAPFDLQGNSGIRIIQPDLIIRGESYKETFLKGDKPWSDNTPKTKSKEVIHQTGKEEYMEQVGQLRTIIAGSSLDKLVLSRISSDPRPAGFNPSEFLQELRSCYPDAFVFMLYIADTGLWYGASPEPLMQLSDKNIHTVSLAGTRPFQRDNQAQWGEKEIDEQEIVTRYIENIFHDFDITDITRQGPITQRAGSVEHLLTRFSFPANQLKAPMWRLLDAIHPTPSVCGLPKELAMDYIRKTEKHRREYYTGFLGPVNMYNEWHLFVNLRSMKAEKDLLHYYLGAGITAGSDPESEWDETCNKKKTLQNIVENPKHP